MSPAMDALLSQLADRGVHLSDDQRADLETHLGSLGTSAEEAAAVFALGLARGRRHEREDPGP